MKTAREEFRDLRTSARAESEGSSVETTCIAHLRLAWIRRLPPPFAGRAPYRGESSLVSGHYPSPSTASTPSRSQEFFRVVLAQSFGCLFEQQRSELHGFDIHTSMFTDPGRYLL